LATFRVFSTGAFGVTVDTFLIFFGAEASTFSVGFSSFLDSFLPVLTESRSIFPRLLGFSMSTRFDLSSSRLAI